MEKTDWKKVAAEDPKFVEFIKEWAYLITFNSPETLALLYGAYQSGSSPKELIKILRYVAKP